MNPDEAEGDEASEDGQSKESGDEHKPIQPPDIKKFEREHAKLQSAIREKEAKFKALPRFSPQSLVTGPRDKQSLETELEDLKAKREKDIELRKQHDQELRTLNTQVSYKHDACSKLQAGLRYKTESRIDEVIRRLEHQINAQQLTLKEEKRIVSEIDAHRRSKKRLHEFLALNQVIRQLRERQTFLRNQRDDCVKRINASKSREEQINSALDALERMGVTKGADQASERESLKTEIDQLYSKKRELEAAFSKEKKDYYAAQAEARAQAKARRKELAAAKKAEERAAHSQMNKNYSEIRTKERRLPRDPHEKEKAACSHLLSYMERLLSSHAASDVTATQTSSTGAEADHLQVEAGSAGDGVFLRRKSANDELVGLYAGLGTRLSRKGSKKGRRSSGKEVPRKLTLHPTVIDQLFSLHLTPPSTMADIPRLLGELQAKRVMLEESPPSEENKPSGDAPVPEMSPITDESPVPQTGRSSGGRISEDPRPDTEGTAGSSEEREAAECHASVSVGDISPLQASSGRSDLPCSTGQSNDSSAKPCDVCGESTTHERTSDAGHGTSDARHGSSAVPSHVTGNGTSGNRLAEESDPLTSAETETSACSQIPKSIEDSSVLKQRFMNRTEDGSADLLPSGTKGLLENGHEDKEHSCMVDSGTSSNSRLPLCENGADSVAMGDNFHPRNPPMKNVELSEPAVSLPCAEKCVA